MYLLHEAKNLTILHFDKSSLLFIPSGDEQLSFEHTLCHNCTNKVPGCLDFCRLEVTFRRKTGELSELENKS